VSGCAHRWSRRGAAGIRGIERHNGAVRIGSATTQAAIERSADVAAAVPLLARATPLIGHFQIRNRGTVGGSLAHADPAAEYPAVALALDAHMEILSPGGSRRVPAGDFSTGLWTTAVGDGDLLTAVTFPVWEGRCGFAVDEVARRHGDLALAGACGAGGGEGGGGAWRWRRWPAATATSPWPAPASRSGSTAMGGWSAAASGSSASVRSRC